MLYGEVEDIFMLYGLIDIHIFVNWQADKGRESGMNHENTTSDR